MISDIASARVRESLRNPPSTAEVTVVAPGFFTPRKVMQDKLFRQRFPDFAFTEFKKGLAETIAYYQKIL